MEKKSNYKEVKWDPIWQGIGMREGDVIGCWLLVVLWRDLLISSPSPPTLFGFLTCFPLG
jgi:hypothetical protein